MKTSQTALHLSVMLAISLSGANGAVLAGNDLSIPNETEATQQQQPPSEIDTRSRHRINETEFEQTQRNRFARGDEHLTVDTDRVQSDNGEQQTIATPSHDRDRTRDRDNIHQDNPTFEQTQTRQRVNQSAEELTEREGIFEDRFSYQNRASGQGFATSGSMYHGSGNSISGNATTTMGGGNQGIKGGAAHGSGGGNKRR